MEQFIASNYKEYDIESIEIIDEDLDMYDIEVEEDHTFCITNNNIISHNCNNLMKALTIPALKTNTAMIVLNHIYQNPGEMYSSKIQQQSGGLGLQYMCSINIQCTRLLEKDEDKDSEQYYGGTHLRFFTVKNRFARPGLECDVYLDFKKGFTRPFESLWDEFLRGGFILNPKQGYYTVPSWKEPDKCWRQAQLIGNVEVIKTFLPAFEKWSQEDLRYSELNSDAGTDALEAEATNLVENMKEDTIEDNVESEI